jgi:WXG100 family type VII secretion target
MDGYCRHAVDPVAHNERATTSVGHAMGELHGPPTVGSFGSSLLETSSGVLISDRLNVSPQHLLAPASTVDEHSQNIFATHTSADERVDSSLFSWAGQSQTAMAAKAAEWATVTTAFSTRLYEHGEGLRVSGLSFADMDARGEKLASLSEPHGPA